MISQALTEMVHGTFTKFGDYVPQSHVAAVVEAVRVLTPDPNTSPADLVDAIALQYAAVSHVSSHWQSAAKRAESDMETKRSRESLAVRAEAKRDGTKMTVDQVNAEVETATEIISAQTTVDTCNELAAASKALAMAVRMHHESLVERVRTERADNRVGL